MTKLGDNPTFEEWVHHLNGDAALKMSTQYGAAIGGRLQNTRGVGLFDYRSRVLPGGEASLDLNGLVPDSTLTQPYTAYKAFRYFRYLVRCVERGWTPSEFVDVDDPDAGADQGEFGIEEA